MDYRYETKNEAREFHKRRIAFIVIDNKLYYMNNSENKTTINWVRRILAKTSSNC